MKMRIVPLLAVLPLITLTSEAVSQTDREMRLYEIYQTFHSKPTDPSVWRQLTEPLQTETYKIQPGDNLWVISEIFFGDGNYWPKVWSVNSRIENPHLIEPGNEIRFRLGTSETEPSFFITEPSPPTADAEMLSLATNSTSVGIETPPPSFVPKPVLRELPPSLPDWSLNSAADKSDQWGLEIVPRPSLKLTDQTYLQSFVVDGPVSFAGEVIEAQLDDDLMVQGKIIYVRLKNNAGQAGDKYLIVKDAGELQYETEDSEVRGHVLRVAGQLTLLEPLEVKDPEEGYSYYRAEVDKSLDLTRRGLKLISGTIKKIDFSQPGRVSDTPVQVIGGQLDNRGFHFASGNVVYLDKGAANGVNEGDIFMLQKVKKAQFLEPDPLVDYTQVQVGQVQVVDVRDRFATAVVLSGSKAIHPGDGSFR